MLLSIKMTKVIDTFHFSSFDSKIESTGKVFIRYDPIIHGTAATTRPCPRASLLIIRIPTFSTAHEDADFLVMQTHIHTRMNHSQPPDGVDLQLAA